MAGSTINQPIRETGLVAVETLIDMLHNKVDTLKQIILPVELITRASTARTKTVRAKVAR
jgi:DNA-binding LacI/PurR family transcriptional regulator